MPVSFASNVSIRIRSAAFSDCAAMSVSCARLCCLHPHGPQKHTMWHEQRTVSATSCNACVRTGPEQQHATARTGCNGPEQQQRVGSQPHTRAQAREHRHASTGTRAQAREHRHASTGTGGSVQKGFLARADCSCCPQRSIARKQTPPLHHRCGMCEPHARIRIAPPCCATWPARYPVCAHAGASRAAAELGGKVRTGCC